MRVKLLIIIMNNISASKRKTTFLTFLITIPFANLGRYVIFIYFVACRYSSLHKTQVLSAAECGFEPRSLHWSKTLMFGDIS